MRVLFIVALLTGLPAADALADPPPAQGAKPLTELLQAIEKSAEFGYIDEVEWDNGSYEVEYYTRGGEKKKVYIDPVSGNQRP
jgi:hypothetical protein